MYNSPYTPPGTNFRPAPTPYTWLLHSATSGAPGSNRSAGARTSAAPDSRPMHNSQHDASKLGEANCSTRLLVSIPNRWICALARLETPAWLTTTPLGWPVDPEV